MDSNSEGTLHGVCLVVAYDGTGFAGYQLQPAQRTVQAELERAAAVLTGHPVRVRAAGRTDAGVHALAQVVAFDSARPIPARGWLLGLNQHLPDDIRVQRAVACTPGYTPRFESVEKTYRYVLQRGESQNPLLRHRAYQMGKVKRLDLQRMRAAAAALVGTHDFRAFRSADDARDNSVRTLYAVDVVASHDADPTLWRIDVRGTAFMKNMVRIIAGTLIDVGRGRIPLERVASLLGSDAQRDEAGQTAPAHGLTLLDVKLGRATPCPFTIGAPSPA